MPHHCRYEMESLKGHCEFHLAKTITDENACATVLLADKNHAPRLLEEAKRRFANAKVPLAECPEWREMCQQLLDLVAQVMAMKMER